MLYPVMGLTKPSTSPVKKSYPGMGVQVKHAPKTKGVNRVKDVCPFLISDSEIYTTHCNNMVKHLPKLFVRTLSTSFLGSFSVNANW